jgi:hypothetical protein
MTSKFNSPGGIMSYRRMMVFLVAVLLLGGALLACSDSGGPSSFYCTGGTPDLAGAWSLVSIDQGGGGAVGPPTATGSFTFTGTTVDVSLTLPVIGLIAGTGTCKLTKSTITITNFAGLGSDATGPYTFVDKAPGTPDTLYATVTASNVPNAVIISRP